MEATMNFYETQAELEWLDWTARAFLEVPSSALLKAVPKLPSPRLLCSCVARNAAEQVEGAAFELLSSTEDAVKELAAEYTGLYCSCREGAPYPYESVYADDKRLLMRPVRDEVVALYQEAGFVPEDICATEPEDHLGIELAFVSHLVERGKAAEVSNFVDRHLVWVSRFCQETEEQAGGDFYPAVAHLARALANDAAPCCKDEHPQTTFSTAPNQPDQALVSNAASSRD